MSKSSRLKKSRRKQLSSGASTEIGRNLFGAGPAAKADADAGADTGAGTGAPLVKPSLKWRLAGVVAVAVVAVAALAAATATPGDAVAETI